MNKVKDQDFASGLLFILIGAASLLTIYFYDKLPMGTPQRPGTGVLPAILSWCLVGTGSLLIAKTFVAPGELMERWSWRPLLAVTVATITFGLLIDDLGLVVTMMIALTICALGTLETRWPEFSIFLVIMIACSWALFVWLLGMPIPVWPVKAPTFLAPIIR
jgi:hypothetical protein